MLWKIKCTNTQHCGHINEVEESDLVSEMSVKDDFGRVVDEHIPVKIDKNTFIKCEECGYPIRCISNDLAD